MQSAAGGSFVNRMIGAARLDIPTYEEIEHDEKATSSALLVVVLSAIAGGIGSSRGDGLSGLIGGIFSSVVFWAVFAVVAFFVGTRLLSAPGMNVSIGQILRSLGFGYTPLLLSVFGFIPILGWLLVAVGFLWFLATATVGLRQALDVSTGRAIGTAVVSFIPAVIIAGIILAIFGIGR